MNKSLNKLSTIFLALTVSLFLISLAVKLTLSFKQLYYFDVDHLNIAKDYGMKKEIIIKNYNILIDYLQNKNIVKLNMPDFPMSREGEIHFVEVKNIFMKFSNLMYLMGIISLIGAFIKLKTKDYLFLKFSSLGMLLIPIVLAIPFAINFDRSFTAFHKIFFNNDYWEFDPVTDPIINVLPQQLFFHNAILILLLLALFSIVLYLFYRKFTKIKSSLV
ncbi:TIGR01906 family membrane protein [Clostridium swellfunianum]|uniref:TIGR01906 family membrane protein n=1 Tax=Clostridium swellfunianum TaxID=1367462 RepID=UPI00202E7BFB|nr:TIGR01906 family membrane protein [Clostridium swellfunianum]MCM0650763.1 TIGR01906 family membrane protein [Clostridium swellfunianum]